MDNTQTSNIQYPLLTTQQSAMTAPPTPNTTDSHPLSTDTQLLLSKEERIERAIDYMNNCLLYTSRCV